MRFLTKVAWEGWSKACPLSASIVTTEAACCRVYVVTIGFGWRARSADLQCWRSKHRFAGGHWWLAALGSFRVVFGFLQHMCHASNAMKVIHFSCRVVSFCAVCAPRQLLQRIGGVIECVTPHCNSKNLSRSFRTWATWKKINLISDHIRVLTNLQSLRAHTLIDAFVLLSFVIDRWSWMSLQTVRTPAVTTTMTLCFLFLSPVVISQLTVRLAFSPYIVFIRIYLGMTENIGKMQEFSEIPCLFKYIQSNIKLLFIHSLF